MITAGRARISSLSAHRTVPFTLVVPTFKETVARWWNALPPKFPNVETDAFVVMPNHVHGVLMFVGAAPRGRPSGGQPHGVAPTVGDVVGWFKTMTTNAYIRAIKDHA